MTEGPVGDRALGVWLLAELPQHWAQKRLVPFGVPSPVGPSHPVPAVHQTAGVQLPFDPLVTSCSPPAVLQVYSPG
jgi:hypothetical protein